MPRGFCGAKHACVVALPRREQSINSRGSEIIDTATWRQWPGMPFAFRLVGMSFRLRQRPFLSRVTFFPVKEAFDIRLNGEVGARAPAVNPQELADPPGEVLVNGLLASRLAQQSLGLPVVYG